MSFDLGGLNWLAVVIAALVYFLLGALWNAQQSPMGRAWISASGYTSPTSGFSASNAFYIFPAVTSLVAVVAIALLAVATGTDTLAEGLVLGLVVGIGVASAITFNIAAFEFSKPARWTWGLIDATYHVVGLTVAAVILALIR
jgi:uncharacterized protein DUF1761